MIRASRDRPVGHGRALAQPLCSMPAVSRHTCFQACQACSSSGRRCNASCQPRLLACPAPRLPLTQSRSSCAGPSWRQAWRHFGACAPAASAAPSLGPWTTRARLATRQRGRCCRLLPSPWVHLASGRGCHLGMRCCRTRRSLCQACLLRLSHCFITRRRRRSSSVLAKAPGPLAVQDHAAASCNAFECHRTGFGVAPIKSNVRSAAWGALKQRRHPNGSRHWR